MSGPSVFAAAERWPDRVALETECQQLSYAELAARSQSVWNVVVAAFGLLEPETPVAWLARPTVDGIALLLGLVSRGIPVCPLHPASTAAERAAQLTVLQPQGVLDDAELALLKPRRVTAQTSACAAHGALPLWVGEPPTEHPLAILFTSGTGSAARPVVLSRRAFTEAAHASAARLGWNERDKWLLTLPLAHVGGLSVLTRCLLAGRTVVLPRDPADTAATLALARAHAVTLASLVPTQLVRWLAELEPVAWPELRTVLVGGAATNASLFESGRRHGLPLLRTYGLTETCSQVATQLPGSVNPQPSDCGPPLPGYEVRAVSGVLEVRTPSLLSGTWPDSPPKLDPEGWLRTNDRGWVDNRGHVHVAGRRDEVVITGGENVDLREVESSMASCPGVRQLCALGLPDDVWGVVIALVVEAIPGASISATSLAAHAREHLARYKRPRRWCVVRQLALTRSGKIDRTNPAVRGLCWKHLEYGPGEDSV